MASKGDNRNLALLLVSNAGGHAAARRACNPALRRRDVWLGARSSGDGSFPLTGVPHLDPTMRMFRAELTSRSCDSPQFTHTHCLTASCLRPLGPERAPQLEQPRVVLRSLTILTDLPACSPLYSSICLSIPQPVSSTAVAILVLASFRGLTSPTTIF